MVASIEMDVLLVLCLEIAGHHYPTSIRISSQDFLAGKPKYSLVVIYFISK